MQTDGAAGGDARNELTLRGLILGAAITLVFTAANVYLGLKVGLTFASSIPAAVISMAVLRAFKTGTIYENNIVQTVASAAGTLSSIIFVLPGLVMVGWWTGFPFWESFGVCALGGILGVMYTVPLRRAMVTDSDLPYPEGVAAAEVLRVGAESRQAAAENQAGLLAVAGGTVASGGFAAIVATRLFTDEVDVYFRAGQSATGLGIGLSLALLGVGHLVGLSVGLAMLAGLFISWGVATPLLTALHPAAGTAMEVANNVWRHQVRFIGAGTIGISAIWTLGKLAAPVTRGVASALAASRNAKTAGRGALPRTEQDIPIGLVALISVACLVPLGALLAAFLWGGALAPLALPLVLGAVVYIAVAGFLVATACGYMAGLIGSSNSPVSGLAILTVIGASLLLAAIAHASSAAVGATLVAYALFVTAVVLCVATIANDNLQDLKTGQLVDATPWRQQVALIVGVIMGALVIPPILDLLNHAYGFAGAPNLAGAIARNPLPAPQATLISALAKGVIQGQLDWGLIGIGVLVGIGIIALDEFLGATRRLRLPPLAVGIGIYLPASTSFVVVVGAVAGWAFNRWADGVPQGDTAKRLGVLMASGLIVGESLFGVLLAGIIVASGKESPLGLVGDSFATASQILGILAFAAVSAALYWWIARLARQPAKINYANVTSQQHEREFVTESLHVVGIGNAIVDVIASAHDDFLAKHGMVKGTMQLIDEAKAELLYAEMGSTVVTSGGSAANTVAGIASFGGKTGFIGRVRDDALGREFRHDITAVGARFTTPAATEGPATARCLIVVTPDAQRTMNTYLGACADLGPRDIDADLIRSAQVTYLEGYLYDREPAKEAFHRASALAHEAGRKVALSLSDSFCVNRHRAAFLALVDHHVDILFANAAEIAALFESDDFDASIRRVRGLTEIAAVTRDVRGSVIVTQDRVIEIAAAPAAQVVDTTGAGDLYAAGFLYGLATGAPLEECGRIGSLAAASIISHVGARPQIPLRELLIH